MVDSWRADRLQLELLTAVRPHYALRRAIAGPRRFWSRSATTPSRAAGTPVDDRAGDRVPAWTAILIVLGVYGVLFSSGILNAYAVTFGGATLRVLDYSTFDGVRLVVAAGVEIALAVAALILVTRYARRVPWPLAGIPGRGAPALPSFVTVVGALVALGAAGAVMNSLRAVDPGSTNQVVTGGPWALLSAVVDLNAGVCEEIAIVAIPVLLLRRIGWSPAWIIAFSVALRWPFHIYHGVLPSLPWAIIWGGTYCALFLYFRRLLPLIAVHTFMDLWIGYGQTFGTPGSVAAAGTAFTAVLWLIGRSLRGRVAALHSTQRVTAAQARLLYRRMATPWQVMIAVVLAASLAFALLAGVAWSQGDIDNLIFFTVAAVAAATWGGVLAAHLLGWMAVDDRSELRQDPAKPGIVTWYASQPGVVTIGRFSNVDHFAAFRTVAEHEPDAHTIHAFGVSHFKDEFAAAGYPYCRPPGSFGHAVAIPRAQALTIGPATNALI